MNLWIDLIPGLFVFLLGAMIGSFLNVVVYRLPAGLSLLFPASRCPHCLTPLKPTENLPILGWLWLKGRCRHCKRPIALRYPLVEAATGFLFLLAFWNFGWSGHTLSSWIFFSWLLVLSLIDLDTMLLPNSLTRSGLVLGVVVQGGLGLWPFQPNGLAQALIQSLLGAVLGLWLFDLINLVGSIALGQQAMGGGDAKLMAMIGAWLGWKLMLVSAFLACALGAVMGGGAIALGLLDRRQPVPFGPFLALGAFLATLIGEKLLQAYWQWLT